MTKSNKGVKIHFDSSGVEVDSSGVPITCSDEPVISPASGNTIKMASHSRSLRRQRLYEECFTRVEIRDNSYRNMKSAYPWGPIAKRILHAVRHAPSTSIRTVLPPPVTREMLETWRVRSMAPRTDIWQYSPYEAAKDRSLGRWVNLKRRVEFNIDEILNFQVTRSVQGRRRQFDFVEPIPLRPRGFANRDNHIDKILNLRMRATGRNPAQQDIALSYLGKYMLNLADQNHDAGRKIPSVSAFSYTLPQAALLYSVGDISKIRDSLIEGMGYIDTQEAKNHLRICAAQALNYCGYVLYYTFRSPSSVNRLYPSDKKITAVLLEMYRALKILALARGVWQEYLNKISKEALLEVVSSELWTSMWSDPKEPMMGEYAIEPPKTSPERPSPEGEGIEFLTDEELEPLKKVVDFTYRDPDKEEPPDE